MEFRNVPWLGSADFFGQNHEQKNKRWENSSFWRPSAHHHGTNALSLQMRWQWDTAAWKGWVSFFWALVSGLRYCSWRYTITLSQPAALGADPHLTILVCRCSDNDMSKRLLWGGIEDAGADACHSLLATVPTANCQHCTKEKTGTHTLLGMFGQDNS